MSNIVSSILKFFETMLICTTFVFTVLLSLLPLILLYFWKSIIILWVKIFHRDLSPMKPVDYMTVTVLDNEIDKSKSNTYNSNGGIYCKLKGKVDGRKFFKAFEKNVIKIDYTQDFPQYHKHIRFHQTISKFGGYWFFKSFANKLKYKDHVTCTTLGDKRSYEEEICNWLKIRYNIKKCPLWGILLIYRKESNDTIFAFKIHHVLADGFSVVYIIDLLANAESKYPVQDVHETMWNSFKSLIKAAFKYFEYLTKTILTVAFSPLHRLRLNEEDDLFLTQVSIPVSLIKNIRQKKKVRFQAVMLDLIVNYVKSIINNTVKKENIPDKICTWTSLPWPNHPQKELCNHFTTAPFAFKIKSINNSREESITEIDKIFEDFTDNHCDRAVFHSVKPLSLLPVNMIQTAHRRLYGKISAAYGHLISSGKYSKILDIECCDINGFLVPSQPKLLSFIGFTVSNEIKLTILGPKSLFSSQQQADQFLKENMQNYLAKHTENAQLFE